MSDNIEKNDLDYKLEYHKAIDRIRELDTENRLLKQVIEKLGIVLNMEE